MNLQNRRQLHIKPPKNNIRVIREGHLRLSDRRSVQSLNEDLPEPKINSSVLLKNSTLPHSTKMLPLEHHSADRLLDLSTSSSSSLSVKSCFGSIGTLKVKVPASSLREVQNLPENMEISLNCRSTPQSLSPEFGCRKQVLVEKHSPSPKGSTFPSSCPSFDANHKKGPLQNGLQNKTEGKEYGLSDMFFTSTRQNQPGVMFSEKSSENSLKPDVLISNSARLDNSKDSRKTVSKYQTCPIRIHQGSDEKLDQALENSLKTEVLISDYVGRGDSEANPKPVSNFSTRPIRVHQGSVATGNMLAKKKIPNNSNVQITNFSVLDSLAARKALLSKKTQSAPAPVRRTVPVKVITSTNPVADASEKKDVCHSCKEKSALPDAVSAVAAATAAAMSTQPLLSSQNKLESQLAMLLEKMNTLEQEAALKQKELENESKTQKITNLESQLNQVTEERMKNLEELQRQLFRMQTKFLSVTRSFEKMSGHEVGKCLPSECQKPTVTQEEKNVFINSSLNTSFSQELKNNPSMSSGYQTLSVPVDQQSSFPDDKASFESSGCENLVTLNTDSEMIQTTKQFNSNNSGRVNANSVGRKHTPKNIYVPFLEKKAKVSDHKLSVSEKIHASSVSSRAKGTIQSKPKIFKETSKPIAQKKSSSVRNKVGSQEQHGNVRNKQFKEKSSKSEMKSTLKTKEPSSGSANSRYSVLKDFVSGRYSQQPYLVPENDNIPKSTNEKLLNTSFTIDVPIIEKEDGSQEPFSQVELNRPEGVPLEKYLLQSPDKSLLFTQDKIYSGQQPSLPSAEVLAGQEALRKAQTSRMVLEANLGMVERDQEKDAVYGLVDNLYEGSPVAHRLQLRRKVDQIIAKVQKDIQNELSQAKSLNPPPQNKKSSTGPLHGRNAPAEKPASQKVSANKDKCQDSDYLTKVFGKANYQNKRTTVKNLYMRFQNQPKAKSPRPKETVPVKGVQMKSAKTQTPQEKWEPNQEPRMNYVDGKKYFFASSTEAPNSANLQHGHLGFMAVALREPRMDSGLKMPVTIRAGDSLTMAPEDQPKLFPASNVMLCNIPVYDKEQVTVKRKPALVKQTLPSVVIEAWPETSQLDKNFTSNSKLPFAKETKKNTDLHHMIISNKDLDEQADACSESSESIASSEEDVKDESLIILSGSNPKVTGGKSCITTTGLVEKRSAEDILDSLPSQDFVPWVPFVPDADPPRESPVRQDPHKEAFQWIEEEILSQILSQHSNQSVPLPSSDIFHERVDNVPENETPKFENNILLSGGLQSTNPPSYGGKVLISQLVEELLVDKINEMMTEALPENKHHQIAVSNLTSPQNELSLASEEPVLSPQTPELTPELSEKSLASTEHDVPLPCTPSASPEPLLEENSPITEDAIPKASLESKITKDLFQEDFKEKINRLREEKFPVIHPEEEKDAAEDDDTALSNVDILVTPQLTPSLTPIREGSPVTPASSVSLQLELQNKGPEEHIAIRTPSLSAFSQDSVEEVVDIKQDELQLINFQDDIASVKKPTGEEEEISLSDKERFTDEAMKHSESASPEETGSVSTTETESETIFESLSVGQWLLSKSEGQAADFGISEKAYKQVLNDASTASTLRDTEDLFHDETTDMTYSEGEVVYKSRVPPERDPILELVSQMQNRDLLMLPDVALLQSNGEEKLHRSLGELSLFESELNHAKDVLERYQNDHSLKLEGETLNRKLSGPSEFVSSQPDAKEENLTSEEEIYVSQKGTRIIEVGKRVAEPSVIEAAFSKDDPTQWKGVPSQIELGSISDSDQTNFMQKSVRFSEDEPLPSIDYAAYWESGSDLVTSDGEKLNTHSLHEPAASHENLNQEEPEQRRWMSVMIPQPNDEEDIEEISLGEEK